MEWLIYVFARAPVFKAYIELLGSEICRLLNVESVISGLNSKGKQAFIGTSPESIAEKIATLTVEGDIIVVLSNGGFGGIHEKLIASLKSK